MKYIKNSYVLILLLSILCGCSPKSEVAYNENHEKVKSLFQSDKEPTAKDAVWTAQNIFKVGVIDDGTKRDGYAKYVCAVLDEYGFKGGGIWVQIIDIVKLTSDGKWVKLGESRCDSA